MVWFYRGNSTPKDIITSYKTLLYKDVTDETLLIAEIFSHYGASQRDFDLYIQEVLPKARLKNMTVNNNIIPDAVFDGNTVGFPGYYIEKMHHLDPMCAMLGHKTGCCQSLGGQGEPCAIYGITHERGGFYVLRKGNPNNRMPKDDIKAQSFVWAGSNNVLVLDSIEVPQNVLDAKIGEKDGNDFICAMYQGFAKMLIEEHNVPELRVGTAGNTPDEVGEENIPGDQHAYPVDYNGYRDSRSQRSILHKDAMWVQYINDINDQMEEDAEAVHNELFEYLNTQLADNPDIEITKIPSMRNFIIWAMRDHPDVFEKFISQADSERQKPLYDFIDKYKLLYNAPYRNISLIKLVESQQMPTEIFELPFSADDSENYSLLHLAVHRNDKDLFNALLKRGMNINQAAEDGLTPLLRTMVDGNIDFAFMLINKEEIDLNLTDHEGDTPLIKAIKMNETAVAQRLIESSEVDLDADNFAAKTGLFFAIAQSNLQITSLLIEHGAENVTLDELITVLEICGRNCSHEQIEYLMQATIPLLNKKLKTIHDLKKFLGYGAELTQIALPFIGEIIQNLVKSREEIPYIVERLSASEMCQIIQSIKNMKDYVTTLDDLIDLCNKVPSAKMTIIEQMGSKMMDLIVSNDDYCRVAELLVLSDKGNNVLNVMLLNKLPHLGLGVNQLLLIMKDLNVSQCDDLVGNFGSKINPMVKDNNTFFTILESISEGKRAAFIANIENATFMNYFKTGMSLIAVIQRLPSSEHLMMIDKLSKEIMPKNGENLYELLINASPAASRRVIQHLGDEQSISLLNDAIRTFNLDKSKFEDGRLKDKIPPDILRKLSFNSPRLGMK